MRDQREENEISRETKDLFEYFTILIFILFLSGIDKTELFKHGSIYQSVTVVFIRLTLTLTKIHF